jgi:hypothetical protein
MMKVYMYSTFPLVAEDVKSAMVVELRKRK